MAGSPLKRARKMGIPVPNRGDKPPRKPRKSTPPPAPAPVRARAREAAMQGQAPSYADLEQLGLRRARDILLNGDDREAANVLRAVLAPPERRDQSVPAAASHASEAADAQEALSGSVQ